MVGSPEYVQRSQERAEREESQGNHCSFGGHQKGARNTEIDTSRTPSGKAHLPDLDTRTFFDGINYGLKFLIFLFFFFLAFPGFLCYAYNSGNNHEELQKECPLAVYFVDC